MLERACSSKKSHQLFLEKIQYNSPVILHYSKHTDHMALNWFAQKKCRIASLHLRLRWNIPCFYVKNLQVDYIDLDIDSDTTIECCENLLTYDVGYKVRSLCIGCDQNTEFMEQLSACTRNVTQLYFRHAYYINLSFNANILSRWKLKEIDFRGPAITIGIVLLIVQTCTELTSIKLVYDEIDDSAVLAIAQHCPKLAYLELCNCNITYNALITLSEYKLPLKELNIPTIPIIPTVNIARLCSYALSCVRKLYLDHLSWDAHDTFTQFRYMTELTSVEFKYHSDDYIPHLAMYCHKLTKIRISEEVTDILSLCHVNPLLQELTSYSNCNITDTVLIELLHACPHLHTLRLLGETNITDIGILALSEHCPQLQRLEITQCRHITEAVVLQLLERFPKLTRRK